MMKVSFGLSNGLFPSSVLAVSHASPTSRDLGTSAKKQEARRVHKALSSDSLFARIGGKELLTVLPQPGVTKLDLVGQSVRDDGCFEASNT